MIGDIQTQKSATCPDSGCETCINMCEGKPCWPTVQDAQQLINAGFSDRLMIDRWHGTTGDVYVLSPATVDAARGGPRRSGRCTFLTTDKKCQLHNLSLKPTEGRLADCRNTDANVDLQARVGETWDTPDGIALVAQFEDEHGVQRGDVPRAHTVVTLKDGSEHVFPTGRWHRKWEPSQKQPTLHVLVLEDESQPAPGKDPEVLAIFVDWAAFRLEMW